MQHVVEISQKHVEWKKPGTKEYKSPIIWNSRRKGKKKKKDNAKWQKDQCLLDFELGQGRLTVNIISNTALGANWLYVPIYTDMLIWQTDPSLSIFFHAKYCT